MKPFSALTTRGKARRLRPLALAALERYPIDVEDIELVRNDLNGIFRVRARDGASYLLRVCLPDLHTLDTLRAEVAWLRALAAEPEIHAPEPIPAAEGAYIVTACAGGVPEARRCMLFTWLPGRGVHRSVTPDDFEKLGGLMARLHGHTERWQPPALFTARTLDALYSFGDPAGLLGSAHGQRFDALTRDLVADFEARIGAELERLFGSGRQQVIHADLHHGNVKIFRDRIQPLDFEDLGWGFPAQDIAIALYYSLRHPEFSARRAAFRRGYETVRPWPEDYPGQIDLLMVQRGLNLLHFMLGSGFPGEDRWLPVFIEDIHGRYREMATR